MIEGLRSMRMRQLCLSAIVLVVSGAAALSGRQAAPVRPVASHGSSPAAASVESAQQTVTQTCIGCHSDRAKAGGLSLQSFTVAGAGDQLATTEKMIRKLR